MGKLPANAGSERSAFTQASNRVSQQPGAKVYESEFIRTTDPDKMSRKQRRMCDSILRRDKKRRKPL